MTNETAPTWRKAKRCHANNTCVEIAATRNGARFRDAKNPAGPQLRFGRAELRQFVAKVKAG